MAATIFELCSSFIWQLGWPTASVMSWFGWLLAATLLVVRGGRRVRHVAFLAVVIALTVYAGQLDMLGVVAIGAMVFALSLLVTLSLRDGFREQLRPAADLLLALVAGAMLSAPLLLPGLQLAETAIHTVTVNTQVLTAQSTLNIAFGSIAPKFCYIGLLGAGMAIVAVVMRWRWPELQALVVMSLVLGGIAFFVPSSWLQGLPHGAGVQWVRVVVPMSFGLTALAGIGVDLVARHPNRRAVALTMATVFGGIGTALAVFWVVKTTVAQPATQANSQGFDRYFGVGQGPVPEWDKATAISIALGLLIAGVLWFWSGWRASTGRLGLSSTLGPRWLPAVLVILVATIVLFAAGRPTVEMTSQTGISRTDLQLAAKAGTAVVGFGENLCLNQLNITPEINDELGVHEMVAYDPMLPQSLFNAWSKAAGTSAKGTGPFEPKSVFCPAITSARLARLFGVSLVVTPHGHPGPAGSVFDTTLGKVDLYRIPGASVATISPLGSGGSFPAQTAPETPIGAIQPYPGAWKVTTNASTPQALRLRVTNVPGWHATLDGKPIPLHPFAQAMLQTAVPAGDHTIVFTYWPAAFSVGLVLAGVSAAGLVVALLLERRRHRSGSSVSSSDVT
jgi:hypothetical protein